MADVWWWYAWKPIQTPYGKKSSEYLPSGVSPFDDVRFLTRSGVNSHEYGHQKAYDLCWTTIPMFPGQEIVRFALRHPRKP